MVVWGVLAGTRGEWTGILMAGRERSPLARDECMWCCPLVRPVEGPLSGATRRDRLRLCSEFGPKSWAGAETTSQSAQRAPDLLQPITPLQP